MKKVLVAIAILGLLGSMSGVANAVILQGWTETETSLFTTTSGAASGWAGNTLTLNHGGGQSSGSDMMHSMIPINAVGLYFVANKHIDEDGMIFFRTQADSEILGTYIQHSIVSYHQNIDFEANIRSNIYGINYYYDFPETNDNGNSYVNFIFLEDFVEAYQVNMWFEAGGQGNARTTTFSDVSWIISEGDINPIPSPINGDGSPVPEPATMLLLPLGLAGFRLLRRKK